MPAELAYRLARVCAHCARASCWRSLSKAQAARRARRIGLARAHGLPSCPTASSPPPPPPFVRSIRTHGRHTMWPRWPAVRIDIGSLPFPLTCERNHSCSARVVARMISKGATLLIRCLNTILHDRSSLSMAHCRTLIKRHRTSLPVIPHRPPTSSGLSKLLGRDVSGEISPEPSLACTFG